MPSHNSKTTRFAQQAFNFRPHEDAAIERAIAIYANAYKIGGRGLDYLKGLGVDPAGAYGLRYSDKIPWRQGANWVSNPTLLALFSHIETGQPRGVMSVRIPGAGYPREVRLSGRIKNSIIRLDRLVGQRLILAERLEAGLKARHAGIPVWCCGSSGPLWRLQPIPGVEELIIITSDNPASARAVEVLTAEWAEAARTVIHEISG